MVLVDADAVEADGLRVFELIEILMIGDVAQFGIVHPAGQVDPDRAVLLPEIVRHVRPGHQVEPGEFHGLFPPVACDDGWRFPPPVGMVAQENTTRHAKPFHRSLQRHQD
jgi:hypothetical protein